MPAKDELERISISLPGTLLQEMDKRVVRQGYSSRSELIRDLIRERLVEEKWEGDVEQVVGVLTICFDHHQRGLSDKLADLQHNKYVNVFCSTHIHMDHHNCLETIILKGRPNEIEKLSITLGGLKGVKFARLTRASIIED
ncbi:MAG: nickel-responsive transcriptional regulator NikR [bacterium]|nr:nickel-responsive transcriptional regulator NikR [bacterium]